MSIINKNMMGKYVCCLLILVLGACHKGVQRGDNHIVIDLTANVQDTLFYSSFVDSLRYINLETTESCLIGKIKDVIISSDRIFVLDDRLSIIWIFDKQGRYLNKIDRKGDGPEEYKTLNQFDYDEENQTILLLDIWTKAILSYDLNGDFVKKVTLEMYPSDFVKLNDHNYLLSKACETDSTAGFYLADSLGHTKEKLVDRNRDYLCSCNFDWEFSVFDDTVSFMAPDLDNVVYQYVSGHCIPTYPIVIKPEPTGKYNSDTSAQHIKDFVRTNYIESSKWIFASYWSSELDLRILFYSKERDEALIGKNTKNDLDGIEYNGKTSASDNNTLTFWCKNEIADLNPVLQILHLK